MKLYVLTCITEDMDIVSQSIFTNSLDGETKLKDEYDAMLKTLQDEGNDIVEEFYDWDNAEIAYGGEPLVYKWCLREVEC